MSKKNKRFFDIMLSYKKIEKNNFDFQEFFVRKLAFENWFKRI